MLFSYLDLSWVKFSQCFKSLSRIFPIQLRQEKPPGRKEPGGAESLIVNNR